MFSVRFFQYIAVAIWSQHKLWWIERWQEEENFSKAHIHRRRRHLLLLIRASRRKNFVQDLCFLKLTKDFLYFRCFGQTQFHINDSTTAADASISKKGKSEANTKKSTHLRYHRSSNIYFFHDINWKVFLVIFQRLLRTDFFLAPSFRHVCVVFTFASKLFFMRS